MGEDLPVPPCTDSKIRDLVHGTEQPICELQGSSCVILLDSQLAAFVSP